MEFIEQLLEVEEEFIAACTLWQHFIKWNSSTDEPHKGSVRGKAANMDRRFEEGHRRILEDYFLAAKYAATRLRPVQAILLWGSL